MYARTIREHRGLYRLVLSLAAAKLLVPVAPAALFAAEVAPISQVSQGADGADGSFLFPNGSAGEDGTPAQSATLAGSDSINAAGSAAIRAETKGGRGGEGFSDVVNGVGGGGGEGGGGRTVTVTVESGTTVTTSGTNAKGIIAQSLGGAAGNGGSGTNFDGFGGFGGFGGSGGGVHVDSNGTITTNGSSAEAILAHSEGGNGGDGGTGTGIGGSGLGGLGRSGGAGLGVTVDSNGEITTHGGSAHGINAASIAGKGGDGGTGIADGGVGNNGGVGGNASGVNVTSNAAITTEADDAHGIFARSVGGTGGAGGSGVGVVGVGGDGNSGGNSGAVKVTSNAAITTGGDRAIGIFALSRGGAGGVGGDGAIAVGGVGGDGGAGGAAGAVTVTSTGAITTRGDDSHGIVAQSQGGSGGDGGFGGGIFGKGGAAAGSGSGGNVDVTSSGTITTHGTDARGIYAQSVGGLAGTGGAGVGIVGFGSSANSAGNGGTVQVTNHGAITTTGSADTTDNNERSDAIFAQSVGGGGGSGGVGVGLFAFGGTGAAGGSGNTVTVENTAALETSGPLSNGIYAQSLGGGGGQGGGSVSLSAWAGFSLGGSGGTGGAGSDVNVTHSGSSINTGGDWANGIMAQSLGGGGGTGGFAVTLTGGEGGSMSVAVGGAGGNGGSAGNVSVNSTSNITTAGNDALGIFAQSQGGGGGSGGFSISGAGSDGVGIAISYGGKGGGGGDGKDVSVTAAGTIQTSGDRSTGLLAQSQGGGGGYGGFNIAAAGGGAGGVALTLGGRAGDGGDGGSVVVRSTLSEVTTSGQEAHGIAAQSLGGGGGWSTFSLAASGGGTFNVSGNVDSVMGSTGTSNTGGAGGDGGSVALVSESGTVTTQGEKSYGLFAQSGGGGGGFGGVNIAAGGGGSVSVNANVGSVMGSQGGRGGSGKDATLNSTNMTVETFGEKSHGIVAQSTGGGGGFGGVNIAAGGAGSVTVTGNLSSALGSSGGAGGNSGFVQIFSNSDHVTTHGSESYALLAQSAGGGGGVAAVNIAGGGAGSVSVVGNVGSVMGSSGGTGGDSTAGVTLRSENTYAETFGDKSHAIAAQSIGGGGGFGGVNIAGGGAGSVNVTGNVSSVMGSSGGAGGKANLVELDSAFGTAKTHSDDSYGLFAQSQGGGGGVAAVNIVGGGSSSVNVTGNLSSVLGGAGGTGSTGDHVTLTSTNMTVETDGQRSHGVVAQSAGGGGGFGGVNIAGGGGNVNVTGNITNVLGGSGGSGGNAGTVNLSTSSGSVTTHGNDAHGVLAQSLGGGGGVGAVNISGGVAGSVNVTGNVSSVLGRELDMNTVAGAGAGVTLDSANMTVTTQGDRSSGIAAQSLGGAGGFGGVNIGLGFSKEVNVTGNLSSKLGNSGGIGGGAGDVKLYSNSDVVTTHGDDSYGLFAQSQGGGGGVGGVSVAGGGGGEYAVTLGVGGTGGTGGSGSTVTVKACVLDVLKNCDPNAGATGSIQTSGLRAYGIYAQSAGGGGGAGGVSVVTSLSVVSDVKSADLSFGGSGNTGGSADNVTVHAGGSIKTSGDNAEGILAQSLGGGGGAGAASITAAFDMIPTTVGQTSINFTGSHGGEGGEGNSAGEVHVETLSGSRITTSGYQAYGIHAQSQGGGGGDGGLSVAGVFDNGNGRSKTSKDVNVTLAVGGFGGNAGTGNTVEVTNKATIGTTGDAAHGIYAQSIGGGGGSGGDAIAGALIANSNSIGQKWSVDLTLGGFGGDGNTGGDVTVKNQGTITTGGTGSYGILAESIGGGGGDGGNANSFSFALGLKCRVPLIGGKVCPEGSLPSQGDLPVVTVKAAVGGEAGSANNAGKVEVTNDGSITTTGRNAAGIQAQSIGHGGGNGGNASTSTSGVFPKAGGVDLVSYLETAEGVLIDNGQLLYRVSSATVGGFGGGSGAGGEVIVTNNGTIKTEGTDKVLSIPFFGIELVSPAHSSAIVAQSIGGGGGIGGTGSSGMTGIFSLGGFGGVSGDGGKVTVTNNGTLTTVGGDSFGILAQSVGGGGGVTEFQPVDPDAPPPGSGGTCAAVLCLGGFGGAQGSGGEVVVDNNATIATSGNGSRAIYAQSIGGGGGALAGGTSTMPHGAAFGGVGGAGGAGGMVTVTNNGNIKTEGESAEAIFAQSVGGGGGSSKASLALIAVGGAAGSSGSGGVVTVNNYGQLETSGKYSSAISAQSIGGGGGDQQNNIEQTEGGSGGDATSLLVAVGGKAGSAGDGGAVNVTNFATGTITTHGDQAHGIFAQSIGGGGGSAGSSMSVVLPIAVSIGVGGAAGGVGGDVTITNNGAINTSGQDSNGIVAQSIGGGGGAGSNSLTAPLLGGVGYSLGGSGGSGGTGGTVKVDNLGAATITVNGANSTAIFAQSVGGGGGSGGSSVGVQLPFNATTSVGGSGGSGGTGGNVTVSNEATITLNGGNSIGIMGQSIGGGGGTTKTFVVPVFGFELEPFKTTIGGSEGANGAGGDVTVTNSGTININGDNSVGIFAQSVGGGGGLVQLKGGAAQLSLADGGVGNGGTQTVTNTGDIFITGKNSVALFGQSIGGGGGAVIGDSPSGAASSVAGASSTASAAGPIFSGTSGGSGNAAPVVVNQTGHLVAMGENSTALVAQSDAPDGAGDITVNILNRSPGELSVIAGGSGSGAGVKILGGADNQLNNNGMITNVLGTDGNAILGDKGNNTVNNFGAVIGSVDLGTGAGAFNNSSGASFSPGATVNLSGGLLSNSGVFTPGGSGKTQTTALTGNLSQSGSGSYNVDLDVGSPSAASDRVNASGTADLAGQAVVNPTNTGFALPGSRQATIVSAAGGATDSGLTLTAPESAVIKYELLFPNATDAAVNFTVDFAPQGGLNGNQSAIGRYINRIQLAGGSDAFAPIAAALVGIPTVDGLASAYDGLSPEPFAVLGNTTWHSNQQFGNALLSCRARDGDFRFVREDECGWMTFGGGASHQDRTSSNIGYNRNAFIAAGGLQKAIGGSNWRAGIGFGYESNWLTVPDIARSEGHQAQGGLTLKGRWGGTTLAFAATGGHGWFESSRSVSLGVGTAKSDPHLSFGSFQVQLGHSFERAAWYLRPLVNSAVNYVHLHSFSEHGAGGANLRVRSDDEAFVTLGPALEMGGEIKLDYGILIRPFTRLGFSRLLSGVNPGVTASFQGAPAGVAPVTVRNENDRNFGEVSLGVDVLNVKGLDIRAGYNGQFSKHSESHGGNLKLSIPF